MSSLKNCTNNGSKYKLMNVLSKVLYLSPALRDSFKPGTSLAIKESPKQLSMILDFSLMNLIKSSVTSSRLSLTSSPAESRIVGGKKSNGNLFSCLKNSTINSSWSKLFKPSTMRLTTEYSSLAKASFYAPFFGAIGCASAIVFTCFGAAYGTAKSGVGICATSVLRPDLLVKNIVPVIMAGIIAIYGLVVSVLVSDSLKQGQALYTGFIQLGAGLSVGLSGLAAGFAIGIVGDAGVRGTAHQPRLFVGMILILIFAEVLGLYGLIVALLLNSRATQDVVC
ncbi:hypothetical protein WICPIJ_001990 [Wickerhamomyces pijperi]|uniref:V-type proton ATPase proteolipid subunit n=1 Tax=Wickerhamomyces pijperi TaxID=599730 RepID=A0A9P8TPC8_WICPI|nr:hypothetical protein WICPIJ_001990 [Wickerhamomyces pijperi]